MKYLGTDLGGTNVAAAVVDSEGTILGKVSLPTPRGRRRWPTRWPRPPAGRRRPPARRWTRWPRWASALPAPLSRTPA
ncbi:MAG: hypothetical protein ACLRIS_10690 [Flavonifractor plautii]